MGPTRPSGSYLVAALRDDFRTFLLGSDRDGLPGNPEQVHLAIGIQPGGGPIAHDPGRGSCPTGASSCDLPAENLLKRAPWERVGPNGPLNYPLTAFNDSRLVSRREAIGISDPKERRVSSAHEPIHVSALLAERYDREELYRQVWNMPLEKLGKLYGKNDSFMGGLCRRLGIPLPGVGYWNKRNAGKPVETPPPLPPALIGMESSDWVAW